jgi:hypothetical protein
MVALRGVATLLIVLCTGAALVACSTPEPAPRADPSSVPTSSVAASSDVDVARLAAIAGDFPTDFTPRPPFTPRKVVQEHADLVGDIVSSGRPFTVDPPNCRALFKPVEAQAGADRLGVGAEGPGKQLLNVSVYSPISVPAALPATGCERMSFQVEDDAVLTNGAAERLAAPNIDGAATTAVRVRTDFFEYVEYFFVAILDDRTFVQVLARLHPDFHAEPLLPDLLTKAVSALRGQ